MSQNTRLLIFCHDDEVSTLSEILGAYSIPPRPPLNEIMRLPSPTDVVIVCGHSTAKGQWVISDPVKAQFTPRFPNDHRHFVHNKYRDENHRDFSFGTPSPFHEAFGMLSPFRPTGPRFGTPFTMPGAPLEDILAELEKIIPKTDIRYPMIVALHSVMGPAGFHTYLKELMRVNAMVSHPEATEGPIGDDPVAAADHGTLELPLEVGESYVLNTGRIITLEKKEFLGNSPFFASSDPTEPFSVKGRSYTNDGEFIVRKLPKPTSRITKLTERMRAVFSFNDRAYVEFIAMTEGETDASVESLLDMTESMLNLLSE